MIVDNFSGHPEPHEFNKEGVKVVYLLPNTNNVSNSVSDQGVIRPLRLIPSTLWKRILIGKTS